MPHRAPWRGAWVLAYLAACAPDPKSVAATQMIVRVEAEPDVLAQTSALRFRSAGQQDDEWLQRNDKTFALDALRWPVDFVLTPSSESAASDYFEVVVEALAADQHVLVQARALSAFVLRQGRVLTIKLQTCGSRALGTLCEPESDCHGPACRTCVAEACLPTPITTPESLPPWEPGASADGGATRVDGGARDAGRLDAAPPETGPRAEAGGADADSNDALLPDGDVGPAPCAAGSVADRQGGCTDVDECAEELDDCDDVPAACLNTPGTFSCQCPAGYTGTGRGADGCLDVDECSDSTKCGGQGECKNVPGSYTCGACMPGYAAVSGVCVDIDECTANNGGCDTSPRATCSNQIGAANTCACPAGYSGNGVGAEGCADVNECGANNGGCNTGPMATCNNQVGVPNTCTCPSGFSGVGKGPGSCINIDNCAPNPCKNGGSCVDGVNAYSCGCAAGFAGPTCELQICSDTTILSRGDLDGARACAEIRGNLILQSGVSTLSAMDLPNLKTVTGILRLGSGGGQAPFFKYVTISALQTVGGSLVVGLDSELAVLALPALTTIGTAGAAGEVVTIGTTSLGRLEMPALTTINGSATISTASTLCSANVRQLSNVTGSVILDQLPRIPFSSLRNFQTSAKGTSTINAVGCCAVLDQAGCESWAGECPALSCP